MNVIWKYEIPLEDEPVVDMRVGARILHVAAQRMRPTLWALVDPEAPTEVRRFRMFGTGDPIPEADGLEYVGTVHCAGDGALVQHLFEVRV